MPPSSEPVLNYHPDLNKIMKNGPNHCPFCGNAFDLDASAFMINANRQIPTEGHFIFFNNVASPDGALHHTGDDPTGGNSADGDDESILVDLSKISSHL